MTEFVGVVTMHGIRWHCAIAVSWENMYISPIYQTLCGQTGRSARLENIRLPYCQKCLHEKSKIIRAEQVAKRLLKR